MSDSEYQAACHAVYLIKDSRLTKRMANLTYLLLVLEFRTI